MTKKEWEHEKELHAEFDRLYPSMKDNWKETMKEQQEDRDAHRAAVEAGYASLAEYIKKWGDDKMDIVERLREFEATDCCSQRKEAANEIERLRKGYAEAIDEIESWGAYASPYFQEKWGLKEIVELHRANIQQKESE